jgi:hypothetical protein
MKKLLFLSIFCVAAHFASKAQGARFGVTAGAAFSNYDVKIGGASSTDKSLTGPVFGVLLDIPISSNISFQPAVNYLQKGAKNDTTADGVTLTAKRTVNNFEIPLNFVLNARGDNGHFFIGAGPTLAFAISGKDKLTDGTNSLSADLKFGSTSDDDLRGLDIGANFMAGYCFNNGLMFSANYNAGLSNLMPVSSDGSVKSHYFGIKIGFLLGGSGKK